MTIHAQVIWQPSTWACAVDVGWEDEADTVRGGQTLKTESRISFLLISRLRTLQECRSFLLAPTWVTKRSRCFVGFSRGDLLEAEVI